MKLCFSALLTILISCKTAPTISTPSNITIAQWQKIPEPFITSVPDSLKYLLPVLDSVFASDQRYRYGMNTQSKEVQEAMIKQMRIHQVEMDTINQQNLRIVSSILNRYGFLSHQQIGMKGQLAITMTIQHADLPTQKKYLPMLYQAAKEHKLFMPSTYAMLEDRIALKEGRLQIFGTQIAIGDSVAEIIPMYRPQEIDARRRSLRMVSYSNYLKTWKLELNVNEYNNALSALLKKYKIIDTVTVSD